MPPVVRSTPSQMVARVGSLLDIEVSDDTVPSNDDIITWLNEGALEVVKMMPDEKVSALTKRIGVTDVGERTYLNEDHDFEPPMRIMTVTKFGAVCTKAKNYEDYLQKKKLTPLIFDRTNPLACQTGTIASPVIEFFPADTGDVVIQAVIAPSAYAMDGGYDENDDLYPPVSWERLIIDYAVMRGRTQDEEPGQANLQYQMWIQAVQTAARSNDFGFESMEN